MSGSPFSSASGRNYENQDTHSGNVLPTPQPPQKTQLRKTIWVGGGGVRLVSKILPSVLSCLGCSYLLPENSQDFSTNILVLRYPIL